MNHVLLRGESEVCKEYVTAILTAEDILRFDVAMENPVCVTVFDSREHLQKRFADLVILRSITMGSNGSEEVAAEVQVEDEKITGERAVEVVAVELDVGIDGDYTGDVFVTLDQALHIELLC